MGVLDVVRAMNQSWTEVAKPAEEMKRDMCAARYSGAADVDAGAGGAVRRHVENHLALTTKKNFNISLWQFLPEAKFSRLKLIDRKSECVGSFIT